MEWLVAKANGDLVQRVDLRTRRKLTVGRSDRCELILRAASVSRRHALLFMHAGHWYLTDTGSRGGLWSRRGRSTCLRLREGEWARIGPAYCWLRGTGALDAMPTMVNTRQMPPTTGEEARATLQLGIAEPGRSRVREVAIFPDDLCTIGRSGACDVVLDDPDVSTLHAVIYREMTRWCIADAGSRAGVWVAGRRYRRKRLEPGSLIELGSSRIWATIDTNRLMSSVYDQLHGSSITAA